MRSASGTIGSRPLACSSISSETTPAISVVAVLGGVPEDVQVADVEQVVGTRRVSDQRHLTFPRFDAEHPVDQGP